MVFLFRQRLLRRLRLLLRNKLELLSPFRPGGTAEGSQVVYGLGLGFQASPRHDVTRRSLRRSAPGLKRPGYLRAPLCGDFCPGTECAARWMTRNDIFSPSRNLDRSK